MIDSLEFKLNRHPLLALGIGHLLDGIAEHGARHLVGMQMEEIAEEVHGYALAHLTEHPADGLVHQVVLMVQVDFCIAETP